jgi:cell division protein FtsI (penicillin-binding protein 3)
MAALLDQNLCNESEIINVENGRYRFKNILVSDTHPEDYLTVKGILEHSSNIGIAKLSQRLDKEIFYKYARGFGFGNYTSIGLPGEVKGSLKKPDKWSAITKVSLSFGYEIAVTPIQLITAYSALINGGILYQPQIVKREVSDGEIIFESSPIQVRTIISKETSDKMREFLISVVKNGTGKLADLNSTTIGGKTGTSKKLVNGRYSDTEYNSSFVGFFPADDPKIVCLILLDSPKVGKYGGLVAAPIFKNIAEKIIKTDLIIFSAPINIASKNDPESIIDGEKTISIKNPDNNEFAVKPINNKMNNLVDLTLLKTNTMPNLINVPVKDAILVLTRLGINYTIIGSGIIVSQSIAEGEKIQKGLTCKLTCKEISINGTTIY